MRRLIPSSHALRAAAMFLMSAAVITTLSVTAALASERPSAKPPATPPATPPASAPAAEQQPPKPPPPAAKRGGTIERHPINVGHKLPANIPLYTLDGKETKLGSVWKDKPALIVSASLTCPVARKQCPLLQPIIDGYKDRVNVVMIYTIDAHPKGDESPYKPGQEWVTPQNEKDDILHPQPKTLEERLKLANDLNERLGKIGTMLVDGMDNQAWKALGSGPNVAILVGTDGKVAARQDWFDAERMRKEIDEFLKQSGKTPPGNKPAKPAKPQTPETPATKPSSGSGS